MCSHIFLLMDMAISNVSISNSAVMNIPVHISF